MSNFDFSPILTGVKYYKDAITVPENLIMQPVEIEHLEKIVIHVSFAGSEYTLPPVGIHSDREWNYYINITLINHRGGKEAILYGNYSHNEKYSEEFFGDRGEFGITLNLIDENMLNDPNFNFDLTATYLKCIVSFSENKITTEDELLEHISNPHYVLYSSKVPIVGGAS